MTRPCGKSVVVICGDLALMTLGTGEVIILDVDDAAAVNSRSWVRVPRKDGGVKVISTVPGRIRLTAFLTEALPGVIVDHINGNTFDNRRANLRICTISENNRNTSLQGRSAIQFKGVAYSTCGKPYRAYGCLNKKQKHIGLYETAEAAARAYDDFARTHYGDFACLNFPTETEQSAHRKEITRG